MTKPEARPITYKCSDQIISSTTESSLVSTVIATRALNEV